jgi:hypothetical protein
VITEPTEENGFFKEHATRLLTSYRHWTGKDLIERSLSGLEQARALYWAPFVVLSHNSESEPILTYANRVGLQLFELTWDELIRLPSRMTAEPVHQAERTRLLASVSRQGFIHEYRGVRITNSGRRFAIEQATVWNLLDDRNELCGQAATFSRWQFLD